MNNKNYEKIKVKVEKVKKETEPKRNILNNCIKAFFVGGLICSFAECINQVLLKYTNFEKDVTMIYTIIIMIFIGALLTGIGVYDRIGQFSGCGSIIPITGFANSMTSSAIESKSEGLILGIIPNVFKLAGSVIVVGVVSGVIFGLVKYLFGI